MKKTYVKIILAVVCVVAVGLVVFTAISKSKKAQTVQISETNGSTSAKNRNKAPFIYSGKF